MLGWGRMRGPLPRWAALWDAGGCAEDGRSARGTISAETVKWDGCLAALRTERVKRELSLGLTGEEGETLRKQGPHRSERRSLRAERAMTGGPGMDPECFKPVPTYLSNVRQSW